MSDDSRLPAQNQKFMGERKRSRFIFGLTSFLYPLIERHLVPRYKDALDRLSLPSELSVLDVGTGSGILAASFAGRGHAVTGLDVSEPLLKQAKKRYPQIDFRTFDLVDLPEIASKSFGIVSCGYLLHGLSAGFREAVLKNISRIAGRYVVVFDYGSDGGWFVRLIERVEGPNYPQFIATPRETEFAGAGLEIIRSFHTSDFGEAWLCRPSPRSGTEGAG